MSNPRDDVQAALGRGAKMTLQQLARRTGRNTKQLSNALFNLKKAGVVAREGKQWHLVDVAPAPRKVHDPRPAEDLVVPSGARLAADAFVAAITSDKAILLLRGDERIRLTPEQSIEVADLVFANFEQG
jgi:hypothetical protein